MEKYSYFEILGIVEHFMEKNKIRMFCTYVCKGGCCGECERRHICETAEKEDRKLACSIYLCSDIKKLILTPEQMEIHKELTVIISNRLSIISKLRGKPLSKYEKRSAKCFGFPTAEIDRYMKKLNCSVMFHRLNDFKKERNFDKIKF